MLVVGVCVFSAVSHACLCVYTTVSVCWREHACVCYVIPHVCSVCVCAHNCMYVYLALLFFRKGPQDSLPNTVPLGPSHNARPPLLILNPSLPAPPSVLPLCPYHMVMPTLSLCSVHSPDEQLAALGGRGPAPAPGLCRRQPPSRQPELEPGWPPPDALTVLGYWGAGAASSARWGPRGAQLPSSELAGLPACLGDPELAE